MKDNIVYLNQILESINKIEEYTANVTSDQFFESTQLQDSVAHRIEIIGEAVKNLSPDIKTQYPHVPWKPLAGMRDKIVHDYFSIDFGLTWATVKNDLPGLKKDIENIKVIAEKWGG